MQLGGMQETTERFEGRESIRRLFDQLGVRYIEHTLFSKECLDYLFVEKEDYLEYRKDPKRYDDAISRYRALVQMGHVAPVYVKWISEEVGYGLFASKDISAGDLIGEYAGVVVPKKMIKDKSWAWKYPIRGKFSERFSGRVSVNAGEMGNELRFINHSDNRNTSPIMVHNADTWVSCYYARKAIRKDEELTVNYGKRYWRSRNKVDL